MKARNSGMSKITVNATKRRESDILDRIENVKRLIEMENTIMMTEGAKKYAGYCQVDRNGQKIGNCTDNLLHDLRSEIQLQLLSITALCYGDNPDVGEPCPMLEWKHPDGYNAEDKFRDTWEECLQWNG